MANLKKKERLEKKHGGFGQDEIRDMYLGVDGDESEDETETNTFANLYSPNDLTGHVTKLDTLFESAIKIKKIIEGALREARSAFPTISEIKTFVDRYKNFYKDVVNVEDDNANVDGEKIEVEAEEYEGGLKLDDVIKNITEKTKEVDYEKPSFSLGFSSQESGGMDNDTNANENMGIGSYQPVDIEHVMSDEEMMVFRYLRGLVEFKKNKERKSTRLKSTELLEKKEDGIADKTFRKDMFDADYGVFTRAYLLESLLPGNPVQ
ncbi:uncharacterized protein LOC143554657 [Bidens hawaiensis]|uniref:uncharacterized protein LOC143554657 n=1 Tax=Bidens hawaiensis TaxID=980011 RepID=UPI00404AD2E6